MTFFKLALALAVLATVASAMEGSPATVGSGDASVKGLAEGTGLGLSAGTGVGALQRFLRARVHRVVKKRNSRGFFDKLKAAKAKVGEVVGKVVDTAKAAMIVGRERASIESMSFVPTADEIKALIAQSNIAEEFRANKTRSVLLSKLHFIPAAPANLCPASLKPEDTCLATMGRDKGTIGNPKILTFIDDRNMPLGGGSSGPNGVLTDCQTTFGPNRMNLFYKSEAETKELLDEVLKVRNANANKLFGLYCDKLKSLSKGPDAFKKDPTKPEVIPNKDSTKPGTNNTIPQSLRVDYTNVCNMFAKLRGALKESNDLATVGLGVNSFCQTWMRKGSKVGDAQFSVMSPHFQTRHFIANGTTVSAILGKDATAQLGSYRKMLDYFDKDMSTPYGVAGGGQAFVNLDKLAASGHLVATTTTTSTDAAATAAAQHVVPIKPIAAVAVAKAAPSRSAAKAAAKAKADATATAAG